jgi:phosphoglycerate dehydrogenase-like enzyme
MPTMARKPVVARKAHISSDPTHYMERLARIVVDNARRLVAGRALPNRVDSGRGY